MLLVPAVLMMAFFASRAANGADDAAFVRAREEMVASQIAARGVKDPKVLAAMRKVERHVFVPDGVRSQAYEDHPLPIAPDEPTRKRSLRRLGLRS